MNPLFFKKKQQPNFQLCKCSLTSANGAKGQRGEKFLSRLYAQSSKGNLQVNRSAKVISSRKEKQTKQSLRPKEKKRENVLNFVDKGFSTPYRLDEQTFPLYNYNLPKVWNHFQTTLQPLRNTNQIDQYTFIKQIYHTQEPNLLRVENRQEVRYKQAKTERSTQNSNTNHLESSIELPSSKLNEQYLANKATISVIEQKQIEQDNCLPRSKSFSLNLKRINNIEDKNFNQIKQNVFNNNQQAMQSNQIKPLTSAKLNDLMFKSAESFQQGSSDQYSELASENQYHLNSTINQNNWSQSLNQIFVKKLRRMSHNTNV